MPSVGSRVSLRYRTPSALNDAALTDVVGHLEALEPVVVVRTKSGDAVEIHPADVVSVRELSHAPVRNSEIRTLEHAAALAWPGTDQHWRDGWLLRAGGGHTSRANSAVPLLFSSNTEALPDIIAWYAQRDLEPWLALPERLLPVKAAGIKPTRMLVRDIPQVPFPVAALAQVPSPDVTLTPEPGTDWLQTYQRDVPIDILTAVVDGSVTFASVGDGASAATGRIHAVGRGAVTTAPDGTCWLGVSCVRVAEASRRTGLARAICSALQAWGAEQGATRAYVQVLDDNRPALTLYESAGFRLHHRHRYVRADSLVPHA
ncbi:N-acetylglutamate synthase, CG3035 family [Mycolicibacterium frederiksbergense]|uniref:GNAT family N-acetyltransferase n=1 Tax=Mycolicibacterium frederiksbergense TaxID=117567 RepID=A0A6H0S1E5_9MYCO|nr:GNAT family N-acetyltransferase [Mycolicibacterium frederiksbergense]QIV81392.1 GNAT family N-acetyltransferase [Mycolicibacterium frederiksbergense]